MGLVVAVVALALAALYVAARRAVTIADLVFERGTVTVARGGVTPPILADLRDVARSMRGGRRVRVRVLRADGRAEVRFRDAIADADAQRIRNVLGSVPLARLVNARRR